MVCPDNAGVIPVIHQLHKGERCSTSGDGSVHKKSEYGNVRKNTEHDLPARSGGKNRFGFRFGSGSELCFGLGFGFGLCFGFEPGFRFGYRFGFHFGFGSGLGMGSRCGFWVRIRNRIIFQIQIQIRIGIRSRLRSPPRPLPDHAINNASRSKLSNCPQRQGGIKLLHCGR